MSLAVRQFFIPCVIGVSLAMTGCSIFPGRTDPRDPTTVAGREVVTSLQQQTLRDGQTALADGEYDTALALFRDVLADNPTVQDAYLGVGDVYMAREDYTSAEPAYRRAVRLDPRNVLAQFSHGKCLQVLGRYVEAIRAYLRALDLDTDAPEVNLNIATCYLQIDEPNSARPYAEAAVERMPENGAARVNLGAVYERTGENAKAIDEYVIALELLDNTPPVMINLINVLARERRYQEAVNTALTLVRVEPTANAYERLGWAYFRLNRYEKSLEAYTSATELDPKHWPSWNGIGVNALNTYLLSEKSDLSAKRQAGQAFRRSLQINPDQTRVIELVLNYKL